MTTSSPIAAGLLATSFAASVTMTTWWVPAVGLDKDMSSGKEGQGVKIALIGGAVDITSPALVGSDVSYAGNYCTASVNKELPVFGEELGESTALASILVATGAGQMPSIAPKASVSSYAVVGESCADDGGRFGDEGAIIGALKVAQENSDIVVLTKHPRVASEQLRAALKEAGDEGALMLASPDMLGESAVQGVIPVSGLPQNGKPFAGLEGRHSIVGAPGADIQTWVTKRQSITEGPRLAGDAPAAVITAGALTLLKAKNLEASNKQLYSALVRYDRRSYTPGIGWSVLDVEKLLGFDVMSMPDEWLFGDTVTETLKANTTTPTPESDDKEEPSSPENTVDESGEEGLSPASDASWSSTLRDKWWILAIVGSVTGMVAVLVGMSISNARKRLKKHKEDWGE